VCKTGNVHGHTAKPADAGKETVEAEQKPPKPMEPAKPPENHIESARFEIKYTAPKKKKKPKTEK
jgi:hypothetical protein